MMECHPLMKIFVDPPMMQSRLAAQSLKHCGGRLNESKGPNDGNMEKSFNCKYRGELL